MHCTTARFFICNEAALFECGYKSIPFYDGKLFSAMVLLQKRTSHLVVESVSVEGARMFVAVQCGNGRGHQPLAELPKRVRLDKGKFTLSWLNVSC